ncbi:MAG: purine-nucleoside phosphorylase [Anaerolineales bacterium]|nr:purine-nucleoside phosphorylase [Anaerolineales bacterium]MBS3752495.1 purine-nucleoside phosphorylase [Anaerolineales bacterium]
MQNKFTIQEIDKMAKAVQDKVSLQPKTAMILGSGLGILSEAVENATVIPYQDIPNWPVSTVEGHAGNLMIGTLEEKDILVMNGRLHYYEGYTMEQVTLPIRVLQRLGIENLIVTNAAGGVNQTFTPGNPMLITDHLNLLGMAGPNPLRGPNLETFGPRFPDMSRAYDRELGEIARQAAADLEITLYEGVYVCLAGPSFETPAELRFLSSIGVDAVGMSTVPEVIVANHGGQRVLGISGITNKSSLYGEKMTTHEEVIATGEILAPKMVKLLKSVVARL